MKKNIKKILIVITLFISTMLFTNKVDAVVMWMQCTANADDEMYHINEYDEDSTGDEDYKKYNTFALINNKSEKGTRHVIYVGGDSNFFAVKGPTFIMNVDHNGKYDNEACWYNQPHSRDGVFTECDSEEDLISVTQLLNGVCPKAIYQTTGGFWFDWGTLGATKGDFVVMTGTSLPSSVETLDGEKIALYYYGTKKEIEEGKEHVMVEVYDANGVYGVAYTSPDTFSDLLQKMGLSMSSSNSDILSLYEDTLTTNAMELGYEYDSYGYYSDSDYVDEAMFTQLVRLHWLGKEYFKITTNEKALLINAGKETKVYKLSNKEILYNNDEKWDYVEEWHSKNKENYSEIVEKLKKFGSTSDYGKLIETASNINKSFEEGKTYTFSSSYDSLDMIEDLKNAYNDLNEILNNDVKFEVYNSDCTSTTNGDAASSFKSNFYCFVFGKNSIKDLSGKNVSLVETVLDNTLMAQLNKVEGTDDVNLFSMNEDAKNYAKELAGAVLYLKNNNLLSSEEDKKIADDYIKLLENFGISLVRDCKTLLGEDLIAEIKKYTNIIKIVVPIILIAFGIIDFTKAMFTGEEDMKKAQKSFVKRVVIAILFFFVPIIVDFILDIANNVWPIISPNSCWNLF